MFESGIGNNLILYRKNRAISDLSFQVNEYHFQDEINI